MAKQQKGGRKKRRSGAIVLLNGFLTLVVIAVVVAGFLIYWGISEINKPGPKDADTAFLVPKGSGLGALGGALQDQGLVGPGVLDLFVYQRAVSAFAHDSKVKPGQYTIPGHASISQILDVLTTTEPQNFYVDVIPGQTSWDFAQLINNPSQNLTGPPIAAPIEGTLLAARQDFFPGDTRQSVVDNIEKAMTDKVNEIWANRDPSVDDVIKNAHQLVTLASLVERETGVASERAQVASVFINRLRKHMRLQTDPSVIYGITQGKGKLDRDLTDKDLTSKSPYNTYQVDGLPPGPIANPGIDALMAVAHPASTGFLYFVAKDADPADGHLFAASYAEHRKNIAKYRQAVAASAADDAKEALEAQQASEAGDTAQ